MPDAHCRRTHAGCGKSRDRDCSSATFHELRSQEWAQDSSASTLWALQKLSTRIPGIMYIFFIVHLVTCETYFLRVDDDHIITTVRMRSNRFCSFSTKDLSHFWRKSTHDHVTGIYQYPGFVRWFGVNRNSFIAHCVRTLFNDFKGY